MPSRFRTRSSRGKTTSRAIRPLAFFAFLLISAIAAATALADYAQVGSYSDVQEPRKAAVEASTGNLFVVDAAADQVKVLAPDGNSLSDLATFGAAVLDDPYGIAIDESGSNSAIYVSSQSGGGEIVKFTSDGEATPSFSVDATFTSPAAGNANDQIGDFHAALALAPNGDLWVADPGNNLIKRFDSSGAHVGGSNIDGASSGAAFQGLMDLATDSTGDLLVVDSNGDVANQGGTSRVERFAADGSHEGTIGPVGPNSRPASIAVNDDDQVIVSGEQDAVYRDQSPIVQVYGADGALVEQPNLSGVTYDTIQGLAAAGSKAYVIHDVGRWNGTPYGSSGIKVLGLVVAPSATIDPVDPGQVTTDSATVSGEVNPNGAETTYVFEYRTGPGSWQQTPAASAGSGTSPVLSGDVELTGLKPNSAYEVRLRATSSGGERITAAESFQTDPSAPTVNSLPAAEVAEGSAWLRGTTNAHGAQTSYHFQWGEGGSLDRQLPLDGERRAGSGFEPRTVALPLRDLEADTTYSFRLVATNEFGSAEGSIGQFTTTDENACVNAMVRAQQGTQFLPDCRAYEQVSPVDKGGYGISDSKNMGTLAGSPDGEHAAFASWGVIGESGHGLPVQHVATRDEEDGWTSNPVFDDALFDRNPNAISSDILGWGVISGDLRVGVLGPRLALTADEPTDGSRRIWLSRANGQVERADVGNNGERAADATSSAYGQYGDGIRRTTDSGYTGFSHTGDHLLFASSSHLVPEDANRYDGVRQDVYVRSNGTTSLVNVDDNGQLLNRCGSFLASDDSNNIRNAISRDGSHIVFSTPIPLQGAGPDCSVERELYVRVDGERTIPVSASQTVEDPSTSPPVYYGASADGKIIYFRSAELLTADATPRGGIYRFDVDTETLTFLQGGNPEFQIPYYSDFLPVGVSNDGSRVYFTSEYLDGSAGDKVLYVLTDGELKVVANAGAGSFAVGVDALDGTTDSIRPISMSDDGSRLVFSSIRDITGHQSNGKGQVFLYDDNTETVACLSCGAPGSTPETTQFDKGKISADGNTVAFSTAERLVPRDSNGRTDVYLWRDGEPFLLSSGKGTKDEFLRTISDDGSSIFFASYTSLVPQDIDKGSMDLYVARVNGGFLAEEETTDICRGDSCQPPPTTAPADEEISSGGSSGGNPDRVPDASRCKALSNRSKKAASKAKQLSKKARKANGKRKRSLKKKAKAKRKQSKRLRADVAKCRREAK